MSRPPIPHDNFREGFIVGYQSIKGISAGIPVPAVEPATRGNMTPFLMGVRQGLARAGFDPDKITP